MSNRQPQGRNWFDRGGEAYAAFRPGYPPSLAAHLALLVPEHHLAVDVGCGTGQLTQLLAPHFRHVIGIDPSAEQLANAVPAENISYQCAHAEQLHLSDGSVNLVTAAQAAHWFDLPMFYREVRRVGRPKGILALISYGVPSLEPSMKDRFQHFYWHEISSFWSSERQLVETGYATLDFPFTELEPPSEEIRQHWNLAEFFGYLSTWSAVRHARTVGREEVLLNFTHQMTRLWGNPDVQRPIAWRLNMRIGQI